MKTKLLLLLWAAASPIILKAQVTQINNNNSLQVVVPLNNGKTILYSIIDSSIWVTDGTLGGTVQISTTIKFDGNDWSLLNGKMIFRGYTASTGSELFISDGSPGGTALIKDINTGTPDSDPSEFVPLNGYLYFSAVTVAEGRELWRTDGTSGNTTLVKDINPGAASSNTDGNYHLYSSGTFLLFAATTPSAGNELWISDGTSAGTVLLLDINTGNSGADSSNPDHFIKVNSTILFTATDATHGNEIWKTDGTPGGTVLVKDINPGTASATSFDLIPGFPVSFFSGFHIFNNKAYFNATDGVSTGEVWTTDGTSANTTLIKDFTNNPTGLVFPFLIDAVNLPGNFIFPFGDNVSRSELWQSDGTPAGTVLVKSFSPPSGGQSPFIFFPISINFTNETLTYPLFQGNKFFLKAGSTANGNELWVSDGTSSGTSIVKDINPGTGNGLSGNFSYVYTSTDFFFAANDGTHGNELWQSDGTSGGTSMVYDINPGAADSDPGLDFFVSNGKVIFTATNGDDPVKTDLYVIDGSYQALPVRLTDFIVSPNGNDALLKWSTHQEINTKNFTIQRCYDGEHFENIGYVNAIGNSNSISHYSFVDPGIMVSGRPIVYYRLIIIDNDGKTETSNIISLRITGNTQWNVQLLSNPVQNYVSVMVTGVSGILKLSVRDISGRIIYAGTLANLNGQITLPVSLQRGIYLLESDYNNERKVIKFLK